MAIELIAKIKPTNGGSFAMVDAHDVELADGRRLDEFVDDMKNYTPFVTLTQAQYDSLEVIEDDVIYLIVREDI